MLQGRKTDTRSLTWVRDAEPGGATYDVKARVRPGTVAWFARVPPEGATEGEDDTYQPRQQDGENHLVAREGISV